MSLLLTMFLDMSQYFIKFFMNIFIIFFEGHPFEVRIKVICLENLSTTTRMKLKASTFRRLMMKSIESSSTYVMKKEEVEASWQSYKSSPFPTGSWSMSSYMLPHHPTSIANSNHIPSVLGSATNQDGLPIMCSSIVPIECSPSWNKYLSTLGDNKIFPQLESFSFSYFD